MNKLHLGDCLEILPELPENSVELVVTDPPYRTISGGHHQGKGQPCGILEKNDGRLFRYNDISFRQWLPLVYRVMKPKSHIYVMINSLHLCELVSEMNNAGFKVVYEKL